MNIVAMVSTFEPADGSAPQTITTRISDPRQDAGGPWPWTCSGSSPMMMYGSAALTGLGRSRGGRG
jgi:hypothetical protein